MKDPADRPRFVEAMTVLAATLNEPMSEARLAGYWLALNDLDVEAVEGALVSLLRSAKFFPKLAAACYADAVSEWTFQETQRVNPGQRLRRSPHVRQRFARVALAAILVEPRKGPRRRRRFCAARRRWKSLTHVRGARKMLKLT